jgi:hypothetical protein
MGTERTPDRVTVTGLFWDPNMMPIVRTGPRSQAAGMLAEILRQFAGLKAASICHGDVTDFYNAAGRFLFGVPVRLREGSDE